MGATKRKGFKLDNSGRRIVVDPVTRIEGHMRCEVNLDEQQRHPQRGVHRHHVARPRGDPEGPRPARRLGLRRTHLRRVHRHPRADQRARGGGRAGHQDPEERAPDPRTSCKTLQVHDHAVHFYHLHALDWVDVVSALKADPKKTSELQQLVSPSHPLSSPGYFRDLQNRLKKFVESGQLGPFMNGYWGNKAYKLPPKPT
jgi:hydrogenase large subunit